MKASFRPFTFDAATRELRRDGEIVKLQSQPAQVLAVLIEHSGEVVTRDALRQAIWGDDTFVDFDKGLNFAIAQVRTALGDSADAPTYIRTFSKRGYQFIAKIEAHDDNNSRRAEALRHSLTNEPPAVGAWRRALALRSTGLPYDPFFLLAAASIVLFVVVAGILARNVRGSADPAHTIAVARFDNQTGLADYDRYAQDLTDAVVAELTASGAGRFAIIGNAAALRVPRDKRDLVAIGDALKARYIVLGQVQRDGERVRVLAHLIRLPEQTHLWVTRVEAAPSELSTPAGLAEHISTEFLRKL